jgi:hypothetical protein
LHRGIIVLYGHHGDNALINVAVEKPATGITLIN